MTFRMKFPEAVTVDETPRVLLVEEDGELYMALHEALGSAGYDLFPAADLGKARRYLSLFRPHVVLLDAGLRHGDAAAFVESLRTPAGDLYRPVIVVSTDERPAAIGKFFDLGISSYLTRPVDAHEVVAKVRRLLRRHSHSEVMAARREEPVDSAAPPVDLAEATHQLVTEVTPHVRHYARQLAASLRDNPTNPTGLRLTHRLRALEDTLERLSTTADELEIRSHGKGVGLTSGAQVVEKVPG